MSADRIGCPLVGIALVLAVGAASLEPWVRAAEPVLDELPTAWTPKLGPDATARVQPDGGIVLENGGACPGDCRSVVERAVDLRGGPWLVEADLVRGPDGKRARLFVWSADDGGRWFGTLVPPGASRARVVVPGPLASSSANVGALVTGAGGELEARRFTVSPARRSRLRLALLAGTALAGTAAALVAARAAWDGLDRLGRVGVGVLAVGALAGAALPQPWVDAVLVPIGGRSALYLQKLGGHGGAFLVLGLLGARSGAHPARVLARLAAFALATETLQLLVPSRSAALGDLAIDLGAGLIGIGAAMLARWRSPP